MILSNSLIGCTSRFEIPEIEVAHSTSRPGVEPMGVRDRVRLSQQLGLTGYFTPGKSALQDLVLDRS